MAKKKKVNKEESVKAQFSKVIGTPTAMLLPARNYKFKVYEKDFVITVPRRGNYVDLDDQVFKKEDGDFDFLQYSKSKREHTVYLPALSKVLFGTAQYPDLNDNQAFTPIALIVKKDTVDIVGNLIEMIKED